MEKEKLDWIKERRDVILYLNQNKKNSELLVRYKTEMKEINSLISQLKNEFKSRIEEFKMYIEQYDIFANYIIDKYFLHVDRNSLTYICLYELRRHGLKIDVLIGLSGWAINLRVLETQSRPMYIKEKFMDKLKDNNIEVLENPQNPYTDEYHVTISEYDFDVPMEILAKDFIKLLEIFG